jgi:O-antigen/teichoic acid export membrane protein
VTATSSANTAKRLVWSKRHPVVFASGILSVATAVDGLAMLAQVALTARLLSKEDFGLLGMAMGWTFVAAAFLDFRVWEVMTIMLPKFQAKKRLRQASALVAGCFLLELSGGVITSALLIISAWLSATYYAKSPDAALLFLIFAVQPLLMSADEPARTLLKLAGQFRTLAIWRGLSGIGQLVLVGVALMNFASPEAVAVAIVGSWIARLVVLAWLVRRALDHLQLHPLSSGIRPLIVPTLLSHRSLLTTTMFSSIAGRLNNRLDVVILGWFTLPEVVAPYDLARRLTSQAGFILGPIEQVVFPRLSKMIATDDAQRDQFLKKLTLGLAAFLIPGILLAIVACPYVIPQVFGDKFSSAVLPAQILLLAYLPTPLLWMRPLLAARMENRFLLVIGYASVLVQLLFGLALTPSYGYVASGISVVAAQAFWWAALSWRNRYSTTRTSRPSEKHPVVKPNTTSFL